MTHRVVLGRAAWAIAAVLPLFLASIVTAQQTDTPQPTTPVTPTLSDPSLDLPTKEQLLQRVEGLKQATEPDDATRAKAIDHYEQAIRLLDEASQAAERTTQFQQLRDSAPQRLADIQKELVELSQEPVTKAPPGTTLATAKQSLQETKIALEDTRTLQSTLETESQNRSARRREIPKQLSVASQRSEEIKATPAGAANGENPKLIEARLTHRIVERHALTRQIEALNSELTSYEARGTLLTARRDQAALRMAQESKRVEFWQSQVKTLNEAELSRERQEAQNALRAAARKHPVLEEIAKRNEALVTERTQTSAAIELLSKERKSLEDRRDTLTSRLGEIKARFEATGRPSETFGLLLRKIHDELPNLRVVRRSLASRREKIERVQVKLIDLDNERRELLDLEPILDQTMNRLDPGADSEEQEGQIRIALKELLLVQRDYLATLHADNDRYFNALIETDGVEQALAQATSEAASYIEERVLWVRSAEPFNASDLRHGWKAMGWVASFDNWAAALRVLLADIKNAPLIASALFLLMIGAVIGWWRSRCALETSPRKSQGAKDTFTTTLHAFLATLVLALTGPFFIYLAAWRLAGSDAPNVFVSPAGLGLQSAAIVLAPLLFLRQLARRHGLGADHFRWKSDSLQPLKHHATLLAFLLTPLVFLFTTLEASDRPEWNNSLGRAAFIVATLAIGFAIAGVFHPAKGVLALKLKSYPGGWMNRLRMIWYPLAVLTPIAIGIVSALGYYYSAIQLAERLQATGLLLVGVVLINAFIRRWLYLERRALALEQRRRRQAEVAASQEAPADPSDEKEETQKQEVDLYAINVQTQKLLGTALTFLSFMGVWLIWADVLPALSYLNHVKLWPGAEGQDPISLINLALSMIILILTFVGARNIPGLLEIIMLQRLPLEQGVRFAIITLCRYLITIIGLGMAFNAIGIGWAKVQWLAAAVSVGLGFGLQEIFANFVSGLILLFEQPIRVGDTVTVGDVTGTVTRIQIRATTITDWNRKELIVPNKEFVTGQLINWSLSDPTIRWVIPVGIAYGSDTGLAQELLLKAAKAHPDVLDDPPPAALFLGFGDNSLNLELRVFCDNILKRFTMISEIHSAIDREFREAGIVIAFPQRDVHFNSPSPIKIEIVGDVDPKASLKPTDE